MAETPPAGAVRPFGSAAFSSCTRCTDPYDQLSSAAANAAPGLLFQFTICPPGGSIAWTCALGASQPFHSYEPSPFVGSPGFTFGFRSGSRPLEYIAMCFESA